MTVIQAGPCTRRAGEDCGHATATPPCRSASASKKPQRATQGVSRSTASKAGKGVFQVLREFRLGEAATRCAPGDEIAVDRVFKRGDSVDVTGVTKGRGYTGVDQAPPASAVSRQPRHARVLPPRRLDRQPFVPGPRVQGQAHGRAATATTASRRRTSRSSRCARPSTCLLVRGAVPGARGGARASCGRR